MQAVIALGSNLGNPAENLRQALQHLLELSTKGIRGSSIWRTAPVGFQGDVPDFCNAVVVLDTELSAEHLLEALKAIERAMGRNRDATPEYESRSIDLDIIDLGGETYESVDLIIPHPRAHERRFVLEPLRELLPDFQFVDRTESLDELIGRAPDDSVMKSEPLVS